MGINYYQHCIIGIKVSVDDLLVVTSPAVYEEQNRYDSKTGKVIGTERVLVKEEESHYVWDGKIYEEYDDLCQIEFDESIGTDTYFIDDHIYFGYSIGSNKDYGKADLIDDELTLEFIQEQFDLVGKRFPDYPVKMYFVSYAG